MAGTLVLTDTITKTFDELFANVDQGTDAVGPVQRRRRVVDVGDRRAGSDRRLAAGHRCGQVAGVAAADGRDAAATPSSSTTPARPSATPTAGAPTLGAQLDRRDPTLNPFHVVDGRAARAGRRGRAWTRPAANDGRLRASATTVDV